MIVNGKDDLFAPKETYCEMNTIKNRLIQIAAAGGLIPITTPNDVKDPLPPLNPAKIGNICPTTARIPVNTLTLACWNYPLIN